MQSGSLLYDLYSIHAMTGREWPMITFIRVYISKHIPEACLILLAVLNKTINENYGKKRN